MSATWEGPKVRECARSLFAESGEQREARLKEQCLSVASEAPSPIVGETLRCECGSEAFLLRRCVGVMGRQPENWAICLACHRKQYEPFEVQS